MSPQTSSITNTPQQLAEGVAKARSTKSFATGKVTIAILVHNDDHDILLRDTFNKSQVAPPLTLEHFLRHEIDLQPFAADDEADVSVKSVCEDAIIAELGPVDVKNMTMLHVCGEAQTAMTVVFVACTVESSEVPDDFMTDLQWLPESVLGKTDLKSLIALLGPDGIGRLLGAREHWKQETTLDTIPDLVSSLPSAPAHMVTGGGKVEAEEDPGYQPDSESSTGTDEAKDISDVDEDYTYAVKDDDSLSDRIPGNGFVFGDENLEKNKTGQGQQLTRYGAQQPRRRTNPTYSAAVDPETDEEDDDDFFPNNKNKPTEKTERRVFQDDSAMTRGSRVPRKQQKKPLLMVDPSYWHTGPRFARPAQKVDGRRYGTKISKTKISTGTDNAIKDGKHMWEDLFKVSPEMRLT